MTQVGWMHQSLLIGQDKTMALAKQKRAGMDTILDWIRKRKQDGMQSNYQATLMKVTSFIYTISIVIVWAKLCILLKTCDYMCTMREAQFQPLESSFEKR